MTETDRKKKQVQEQRQNAINALIMMDGLMKTDDE